MSSGRLPEQVDGGRPRSFLTRMNRSTAEWANDNGGWSVRIPGLPLACDGDSLEEALAGMVGALREYAAQWHDRLLEASNHHEHWGLVQMISLSTDGELRSWLTAAAPAEPGPAVVHRDA